MSFGLSQAGIRVLGGIDNDVDCRRTYEANLPGARYIRHDLTTLTAPELGRRLSIRRDDPSLLFAGCSPCQFWSKIRTDRAKSRETAFLLSQFQRFIRHFRPGFVVVENVPGLYSRRDSSILGDFLGFLTAQGYDHKDGIVNAGHHGVPQNRKRYLLVASRCRSVEPFPTGSTASSLTVADFIGELNGFEKIAHGHVDATPFRHTAAALSDKNRRRISVTAKSGGDRFAWADDAELQIDAYRGKDHMFRDVYGRMAWDRPAPTITTRFVSFSNGRFGHPDEDRAISMREGATLQTFPKHYLFHGRSQSSLARQIGNAVPPALARRIGEHVVSMLNG